MPTFLTHDNGGRPFKVVIDTVKRTAEIFKYDFEELKEQGILRPTNRHYTIPVYSLRFQKAWIGTSPKIPMTVFSGGFGPQFRGNTIVFKTGTDRYVYIGEMVYEFYTKEELLHLVSPVGNNDVPYPYMIGKTNVYFLIEKKIIARKNFPVIITDTTRVELYEYLYRQQVPERHIRSFRTYQIHPRLRFMF
jgi:hypothetical protein